MVRGVDLIPVAADAFHVESQRDSTSVGALEDALQILAIQLAGHLDGRGLRILGRAEDPLFGMRGNLHAEPLHELQGLLPAAGHEGEKHLLGHDPAAPTERGVVVDELDHRLRVVDALGHEPLGSPADLAQHVLVLTVLLHVPLRDGHAAEAELSLLLLSVAPQQGSRLLHRRPFEGQIRRRRADQSEGAVAVHLVGLLQPGEEVLLGLRVGRALVHQALLAALRLKQPCVP
mmetsp:Transcript_3263/g.13062  ORF Transcript_3263/g.13062 Transcript_3263/m.13062 type:complete len:232 (+) Transcript_3263:361-1056(+)